MVSVDTEEVLCSYSKTFFNLYYQYYPTKHIYILHLKDRGYYERSNVFNFPNFKCGSYVL